MYNKRSSLDRSSKPKEQKYMTEYGVFSEADLTGLLTRVRVANSRKQIAMAEYQKRQQTPQQPPPPPVKKPTFGAYKLLIDPVLHKGLGTKVYRFDGTIPDDPLYPGVHIRDPRNPAIKARMWQRQIEPMLLTVPTFKIDGNYVGAPPKVEVTIRNVNDNINKPFLRDALSKFGVIEELHIYYHPITKKHLNLARVIFLTREGAKSCIQNIHKKSMMGQVVEAFFDSFGQKCKSIFERLTTEPKIIDIKKDKKIPTHSDRNHKHSSSLDSKSSKGGSHGRKQHTSNRAHLQQADFTPSSDLGYGTTSDRGSTYSEGSHSSMPNHYTCYQHTEGYDAHSIKHPDSYTHNQYMGFYQPGREDHEPIRFQMTPDNVVHQNDYSIARPKTPKSDDDSPKMDLDTRIKLLLKDKKDTQLGQIVGLTSSDESEAESPQHPKKKARLSISKKEIWDSGSEEENVESAFAKKFKKNTFVPVDDDNAKSDRKHLSPPPSPFLSLSNVSRSQKQSNKPTSFDNELDQVSDDSGGMSRKQDEDDMSLSSLSPDDPGLIQLPPQPPPVPSPAVPPPLPPSYPPPDSYYPNYSCLPRNHYGPMPYNMYAHWSHASDPVVSFQPQPPPLDSISTDAKPPPPPEPPSPEEDTDKNAFINNTISIMLDRLVTELKMILKKDFERKIIQNVAYTQYDMWIQENEDNYKKQKEVIKTTTVTEPKKSDQPDESVADGRGRLGFMSSIPKLPSFRRVVPVPVKREELSAKSGSDTESESGSEKSVKPTRKNIQRRVTSLSSGSISSASSDSESENESAAESVVSAPDLISDEEILFSEAEEAKGDNSVLLSGAENISDASSDEEPTPKVKSSSPQDTIGDEEVVTGELSQESSVKQHVEETVPFDDTGLEDVQTPTPPPLPNEHMSDHNYCIPLPDLTTNEFLEGLQRSPIHLKLPPRLPTVEIPKGRKSRKAYKRRTEAEEVDVLFQFLTLGADEEDIKYLKNAYQSMLSDDHSQSYYWLNSTHWVDYPATYNPQLKPDKARRVHATGCARSEGFYKLTPEEKAKHKRQWGIRSNANNIQSLALAPVGIAHERPQGKAALSREARSNQRRLLTALGNEVDSDLLKFNQLKFRKKSLRFARSRIHDWGLFASEGIAADEMVIEYVGQMIRPLVADVRERKYEAVGIGSSYLFRIDLENVIDATKGGNVSRFINHSCNPNCYAKIISIEGRKKIVIYSKQPIAVNEEITYDYKFPIEDDKIPCLCGSAQCRGTLN